MRCFMIRWKMVREILSLALPAVGEMTLYMMIWILDTMMVGKYGGKLAVSSVGLSTEIIYSFFNILIAIGISSSLTSLISRALGAKDFKKAERIANAGFKLSFALAILFFLILFFVDRKSTRLNSSHANISYAVFCLKKNNDNAHGLVTRADRKKKRMNSSHANI